MQILEMQCIGRLQVPGPSSGIWQIGVVLETFEDEEKQFRAVEFVSRAAGLFYFYFLFFFTHFGVGLFSGQDEVRTSNLLHLPWDFLHSGLMLQQLSHLAN